VQTTTSPEVRARVLALRRTHSLREVAELTGLALGTVKTLCARSGAFRDNGALRALMTLPPVSSASSTQGADVRAAALTDATPAEQFCIETLRGLARDQLGHYWTVDVAECFRARPDLVPQTLADCLHERDYWHELRRLRSLVGVENRPEARARDDFVFGELAHIRPRTRQEALDVLRHMVGMGHMSHPAAEKIFSNLIGCPSR
jgi:hypothetical protein